MTVIYVSLVDASTLVGAIGGYRGSVRMSAPTVFRIDGKLYPTRLIASTVAFTIVP